MSKNVKNNDTTPVEEVVSDNILTEEAPSEDKDIGLSNTDIKESAIYKELYNQYLRSLADMENQKKQIHKDALLLSENNKAEFAIDMIEILDTLYLSLPMIEDLSIAEGIINTIDLFNNKLLKHDIKEVSYTIFDTDYHMAAQVKEDDNKEKGEIIEILQRGYAKKSKLIRPAMVILSK
jgi:molecular chaperone GrpE